MTDQKPIPVAEVLANPEHPLHAEVADVFNKLDSGALSMCACMGAGYGEPYCPCEMRSRGLEFSPARKAAEAESAKQLEALVRSGVFAAE